MVRKALERECKPPSKQIISNIAYECNDFTNPLKIP